MDTCLYSDVHTDSKNPAEEAQRQISSAVVGKTFKIKFNVSIKPRSTILLRLKCDGK